MITFVIVYSSQLNVHCLCIRESAPRLHPAVCHVPYAMYRIVHIALVIRFDPVSFGRAHPPAVARCCPPHRASQPDASPPPSFLYNYTYAYTVLHIAYVCRLYPACLSLGYTVCYVLLLRKTAYRGKLYGIIVALPLFISLD